MSYTIANLKDDLTRTLHGSSLRKLSDVLGIIKQAGRDVLQDVDVAETKRESQITNAIYDKVYDYQLPSDLKSNKIIDIFPQSGRGVHDSSRQSYAQYFEKNKENDTFYIKYDTGAKTLRYTKALTAGTTIASMNSITDWNIGGDINNLSKDTLQYISGGASLKFDLNGTGTSGYLENTSLTAQDLSDYEDEGAFFLWVYMPDASAISSVELRWGSDASNYWYNTVTAKQDGNPFSNGWNLLNFEWDGATQVGSPDSSDIDTVRITASYDGTAETDLRIDNLVYRKGEIFNISYYSKHLFASTAGAFKESPTLDTDTVNLDTDSYNLLLSKTAEIAAQELQGEDSAFDLSYFKGEYERKKAQYKKTNKSEAQKPKQKYYKL